MARLMSLAPALGQLIPWLAGWRAIFVTFLAISTVALTWLVLRQPETLSAERRLPFSPRSIARAADNPLFATATPSQKVGRIPRSAGCPASLSSGAQTPRAVPVNTPKVTTLPMEMVWTPPSLRGRRFGRGEEDPHGPTASSVPKMEELILHGQTGGSEMDTTRATTCSRSAARSCRRGPTASRASRTRMYWYAKQGR